MATSVMLQELGEGMVTSLRYLQLTLLFSLPSWTSSCIWQNVEESHRSDGFQNLYINYERNSADASAYGGVFRTVLSVWYADFPGSV